MRSSGVKRHALPVIALFGLALLTYSNSFHAGFVFDNSPVVLEDARVHAPTAANLKLIFTEEYAYRSSSSGLYRPLSTLSYLFNYAVLGNESDPSGYHGVNLLLHAVNICLVYLLGLLVFRGFDATGRAALALAALWGLHPAVTEAVTNIVGRADLLAGFGVLAGMLCYVKAAGAAGRRRPAWLTGLAAATAIGVFSKESALVLPAAIVLYELTFGSRREALSRDRWAAWLALAAPILAFLAIRAWVLARQAAAPIPFTDNPLSGGDFLTARLTAIKVIGKYLWLYVWPAALSCDYSYNQVPLVTWRFNNAADWAALGALVSCAAIVAVAAVCYRKRKPVFFFLAFFFVALAPTSNLIIPIGSIMAERFLYLPSIGLAGSLVAAIYTFLSARRATPVLAGICIALAARSYARNFDWFDERSLWSSAAEVCPNSYKTRLHLALALAGPNGEGLAQAVNEAERSLAILSPLPDDHNVQQAYSAAGLLYRSYGDVQASKNAEQGRQWYGKALDALLRGERIDRAASARIEERSRARGLAVAPSGWHPLYLELGDTYLRLSNPQKALAAFEYGSIIRPAPEFFEEMSYAYRASGDAGAAEVALLEGILLDERAPRLGPELVDLYRRHDPGGCALRSSGTALTVDFDCPLVHAQMCQAFEKTVQLYGRMRQANMANAMRQKAGNAGCREDRPVQRN